MNIKTMAASLSSFKDLFSTRDGPAVRSPFVVSLIVFATYFITAKFGQIVFYIAQTSPAVLWPSAGIALAAVFLAGYRMWLPIALAAFLASFTAPTYPPLAAALMTTVASTLEPVIGAYILKRLGFKGTLSRVKDALLLTGGAFVISMIAPSITVVGQWFMGALPDTASILWTRAWAGRVLSIMVLTGLITSWLPMRSFSTKREDLIEAVSLFGILLVSTYLLMWTTAAQSYVFVVLIILFGTLLWASLSFDSRITALALFSFTVFGMMGIFFGTSASATPTNQRLFSIELFVVLIAPIFYSISGLIDERRDAVVKLKNYVVQLEQAMQRLSSEDRSKNEFIATLAHELRNPLAPVISTLELLRLKGQSEENLKLVESAELHTHTMRRLLEDLLDVARVAQKKFKLQKEPVLLGQAVKHALETTEMLMRSRSHSVVVHLPREPLWLNVDPIRFEQILVNLLNNAAKYTETHGKIELTGETDEDKLIITVRDTGAGIPAEDLPHIFESFRQVKSHPLVSSGLGIGLSITKRLVEMHDGVIRAESGGPGMGSTFTVELPLSPNVQMSIPRSAEQKQAKRSAQQLKVLVVDDSEAAAQGLEKLLQHKGHVVSTAYSGTSALQIAATFDPHAIVLDIGLPDIDGYEIARKLRAQNASATLIALTGYGQEEDKLKAFQAGFDHHLTKPVGIEELQGVLSGIRAA